MLLECWWRLRLAGDNYVDIVNGIIMPLCGLEGVQRPSKAPFEVVCNSLSYYQRREQKDGGELTDICKARSQCICGAQEVAPASAIRAMILKHLFLD